MYASRLLLLVKGYPASDPETDLLCVPKMKHSPGTDLSVGLERNVGGF